MLGVIANPMGDLDVAGEKPRVDGGDGEVQGPGRARVARELHLQVAPAKAAGALPHLALRRARCVHRRGRGDPAAERRERAEEGGAGQHDRPVDRSARTRLQLVVFNSCDGARTKLDDPFAEHRDDAGAAGQERRDRDAVRDHRRRREDVRRGALLLPHRPPLPDRCRRGRSAHGDVGHQPDRVRDPGALPAPRAPSICSTSKTPPARRRSPSPTSLPPRRPPRRPRSTSPPTTPPAGGSKRKRWLVGAGVGVAAVIAAVVAVVALSSGGDDPDEAASLSPSGAAVETTVADDDPGTDHDRRRVVPLHPGLHRE